MTIAPAKALLLTLTTALTLAAFGARAAHAADVFTLESTTFKDGQLLPKPVGDIPARGANCKGENVSPQLSWSNAPEGTRSFVFVVSDPDAGLGAGITHWVAYGISPETTLFAEGEASQPSGKYVAGKSKEHSRLWRPVSAAGVPAALSVSDRRQRSGPEGLAARADDRRTAGEAERPSQGRIEPRGDLRQPLSAVIEAAAFAGSRIAILVSP